MARDVADNHAAALDAGLAYFTDQYPGLSRVSSPTGEVGYRDEHGDPIEDSELLGRIAALAIPPAWSEVWICPHAHGHIQATGRDAKGRKQYIYHPGWRAVRDQAKYGRMLAFGRALPRLRRRIEADLNKRGLPREKVLAAVVRLLELTMIRIGNEQYARANRSYGLTTLQKKHVTLSGVGAVFEFRGKSGKDHKTGFHDRRLSRVIRAVHELRGQRLFQYVDADGHRHAVDSHDVNDYLRAAMGGDFTAKDFRTWGASLAAYQMLGGLECPADERQAKRQIDQCIKAVAGLLGNTPAVCRASYVAPAVLEAYRGGRLRAASTARARELALLRCIGMPPAVVDEIAMAAETD
jgi:DNA topoisomerase-1